MTIVSGRTPEEIKASVYTACLGDFTDEHNRLADLQALLIDALIWQECPPQDGWRSAFNRQTAALRELAEEPRECRDITVFDWLSPTTQETPLSLIALLNKLFYAQSPWNHLFVDDYIERAI